MPGQTPLRAPLRCTPPPIDPTHAARYARGMTQKKKKTSQVYTLVVQVGRKKDDGLPKGATGAALLCFSSGVDEAEAVRETVAILKQAGLAPLDVSGYGDAKARKAQGLEPEADEAALMQRALDENAVIVAQITPFFDDPQD